MIDKKLMFITESMSIFLLTQKHHLHQTAKNFYPSNTVQRNTSKTLSPFDWLWYLTQDTEIPTKLEFGVENTSKLTTEINQSNTLATTSCSNSSRLKTFHVQLNPMFSQ